MHKGVILLTEAENREEAKEKVEEFLEQYGDGDVWDWYDIGNRWNNTLAPKDKAEEFQKWIHETYKDVFKDGYYSLNDLENEKDKKIIQEKWESLELKGYNPYYSAYGFSIPNDKGDYNIIPLKECVDIVKEWVKDLNEEKEKLWQKMVEAREESKNGKYDISGYYAGQYKNAQYENFCFESNVYNVTTEEAERLPEEIEKYWAVMIDMHN